MYFEVRYKKTRIGLILFYPGFISNKQNSSEIFRDLEDQIRMESYVVMSTARMAFVDKYFFVEIVYDDIRVVKLNVVRHIIKWDDCEMILSTCCVVHVYVLQ